MRWALLLAIAVACIPAAAAKIPDLDLLLQPDGKLSMDVPERQEAIAADCDGTPPEPTWTVGHTMTLEDIESADAWDWMRTRAAMPLGQASVRWVFDVPAAAAGVATSLSATLDVGSVQSDDLDPWAQGETEPLVLQPGRNEVAVPLAAGPEIPEGAMFQLQVVLHAPALCAAGTPPTAWAGPDGSALALGAATTLDLEAVATAEDGRIRVFAWAESSWGGYERRPMAVAFAFQDLEAPDATVEHSSGVPGHASVHWTWDGTGAAPGTYHGEAAAHLHLGDREQVRAALPVVLRIEDGKPHQVEVLAEGDADSTTAADSTAANAPAAPLLPLLAALAVAARYSRASRSATARRTSLPW